MSFYTSLTGLNAATAMLGVTSNNIANVGTTGFKRSRADFGDIFATSPLQKASSTVGQGVSLKQVSQEFGQGNISFSSNALDLAITGDGFFPMRSADGLQETYTRNGSFLLNEQYNVVNSAGQRLMAATVDSTGSANVNDRVVLTIPQKTSGEAKQTSSVSLGLNFPSDAPVITAAFNRTNPATYYKSTAFTVYDAGGNGYLATVYYVKTKNADSTSPTNTWQTHVYVGDNSVNASLQQATDPNGQKLFVNQYGQLAPYAQVKDELTTAKTQLFSLNELTDKRNSVPAAVSGKSVVSYDFSNGENFKARNDQANTATISVATAAGVLAATTLTQSAATAIATATAQAKTYPGIERSNAYAEGLRAAMMNVDPTDAVAVAAAKQAYDDIFNARTDSYSATDARIAAAVATATSAETLGTGATKAQIAAATLRAKAQVVAYDNAVSAGIQKGIDSLGGATPTDAQLTEFTDVAIAAAEATKTSDNPDGYYDSVKTGLSQLFSINVDGSGNPVTLDLGYLANSETKVNGSELAMAATNTLNKEFGGGAYFDLSDPSNQKMQVISSGYSTTDPTTGVVTDLEIPIRLVPGTTPGLGEIKNLDGTTKLDDFGNPVFNAKQVTIDQMVHAMQKQLDDWGRTPPPSGGQGINGNMANTIQVSYDYSASQFKFTDGANTLKLKTPDQGADATLKNTLFGLSQTAVALVDGHYPAPSSGPITPVIPNGKPMRLEADQRFGIQMTYDSVNKTFTTQSGKTGDQSSLQITGVRPNSMAAQMLGLAANGLASDIPVDVVDTSATALRGIPSSPAVAVGTTPLKNISNNFAVDASNNTFVVTVDGVKGTVVIPIRNDYSLDTFKAALQKGINAMGTTNPEGDPVTVNGVKVAYDDANKRFTFTSGTTGAASFVKISGSADWGLDQVEAARGADSTWIKPTQHKDVVSGVAQPKFIDGQGNETTSGDGFLNLPAWSPVYLTKGELTFNTSGKLVSPIQGTQLEPVYLAGGKGVLTININYSASTQYTSPFAVLSQSQDGAPEGDLVGVTIGNDGLVSASFSNGTQKSLAKILLANFSSPVGLRQMGDSTFLASAASGTAKLGNAGSAGFGTLRAGATERANVDLTQELVDLITAQRNFQANAKAIETSSTMTSAIINLRS